MELMEHQEAVLDQLGSGKILWGGVGTGKSRVVMAWYMLNELQYKTDIIVITTARKRDSLDWEGEAARFGIGTVSNATVGGVLTVDSWNNIGKYVAVQDCFFVFDEQRVVGHGAWVKAFIKIARKNRWMLLSATPGDTWMDYAPVFVANGFYRSINQFKLEHVLYEPFVKYPKIRGYLNERKLEILRNDILVEMQYVRNTTRFLNYMQVTFDKELIRRVYQDRWHIYEDRPIKDAGEMWRVMRRVVNSDPSRMNMIHDLMKLHDRLIIWYSWDYELDILRRLGEFVDVYEYNGHVKDPLPTGNRWVYLVQYTSGAEAWNCTTTDAMVLYSLTYSYKNFEQAQGRIDRLDTLYTSLYYYILVSNSMVDRAVRSSLSNKKNFNERRFLMEFDKFGEIELEYVEICEI